MQESDIKTPLVYVMGRDIRPDDVHYVFTITPCYCAVVTSAKDFEIAKHHVREVLEAEDESACRDLALHVARAMGLPVLTVGEGKGMKAVYSNDEEEEICLSNLTSMN
jgi:hypothetical protein